MFAIAATASSIGFWGTDTLINALWITGILVAAYMIVMWIALVLWVYRDIESRTGDQFTRTSMTGMVALFNIPGLLLYLAVRPSESLIESYNRQLEMEAFLHDMRAEDPCPGCRRNIEPSFALCPYCRATVQTPCASCARNLKQYWAICPYCGAEKQAAPAAASMRAASFLREDRPPLTPVYGQQRDGRKPVTTATHPAS